MKVDTNPRKVKALVASRFIGRIYPSRQKLEEALHSGKRLTIYHGVDPTAPDLHLGHSTNFLLLREFQKLGHRIILLIGDFTARIGDPTDKITPRRPLTDKEILENSQTYKKQASKILNFGGANPAELKFNSHWLRKLNFEEILNLAGNFTVAEMLDREMFQRRLKEKKHINLREFLYPLMQGYDSVAMDTDIEVGGTDQTFNMLVGRDLMKIYKKKEKFVVTTPLLENPKTGKKLMSKSEGGYIGLQDSAGEMFGKVMALKDEIITPCLELCTLYPEGEIAKIKKNLKAKKLNPRDAKMILAYEIVSLYHGKAKAKAASGEFERVFRKKGLPARIPTTKLQLPIRDLVYVLIKAKIASSKSNAWRLVKQGGIKVDGKTILSPHYQVLDGATIQAGKRHFIRVSYK